MERAGLMDWEETLDACLGGAEPWWALWEGSRKKCLPWKAPDLGTDVDKWIMKLREHFQPGKVQPVRDCPSNRAGKSQGHQSRMQRGRSYSCHGEERVLLMWWARQRGWERITDPAEQGWEWIWDSIIVLGSWITGFFKGVHENYIRRSEAAQGLDLGTDSCLEYCSNVLLNLVGCFWLLSSPDYVI